MRRMMNKRALRSMAGLTLLETMFAIALGVLVLIAAVVFFSSGKQSTGANKTVSDLNSIASGYQSYIAMGTPLTADTTASPTAPLASMAGTYKAVQAAGFLPTALIDMVGQAYQVTYNAGGTLTVTIPGVAQGTNTCTTIGTMLASSGNSVGTTEGTCTATMNL